MEVVENKIAIQENLRNKLDSLNTEFSPLEEKRLVSNIYSIFKFSVIVPYVPYSVIVEDSRHSI